MPGQVPRRFVDSPQSLGIGGDMNRVGHLSAGLQSGNLSANYREQALDGSG